LLSGVAKAAFKLRAEIVERCFAHVFDRSGMRRTWLRGRNNLHKRYLLLVAGYNLGALMRAIIGAGTPREVVARGKALILLVLLPDGSISVLEAIVNSDQAALGAIIVVIHPDC
jgi:transposase